MTDNDKTLVERLRDRKIVANTDPWLRADDLCIEAADRIESQAAEIEALKTMIFATGEAAATNLRTAMERALEIERLREAGTKLAGYAGHDDNCEIMLKGVWGDNTPCDCGYEDAWKALRDALGEAE